MSSDSLEKINLNEALDIFSNSVDALLIVDGNADKYNSLVRKGFFEDFIDESGSYHALIEKLWFHFGDTQDSITKDYKVFLPIFGEFSGKYSKRLKVVLNEETHIIQMTVYPIKEKELYLFLLDDLDDKENIEETLTSKKVNTIQSTYLFSMYFDIVRDTTNSICISEISDETVNSPIKYSDWRMMIVNMIWPDDQALFLEKTDPEYLKTHFTPGQTSSFDCLMQNLEGNYIWVKLIFCRAETNYDDDYRFVFMVQDIHENVAELMSTLKKYEDLASKDPLTSVYNHGRISTELYNALDTTQKMGRKACIIMLDIDYFKHVNDDYGHSVGDITLIHFAETVNTVIKDKNAVLGRWGGEEFVVVNYDDDIEAAGELAELLRSTIEKEPFNRVGHLTCSIGVTDIRPDDSFKTAFDRMDKAVYQAKGNGRNRVVVR
ncbi:MAG: GGDEF domain-containing protein [Ruminococcus sp.]|nr:GGDEF domain-containing protein [Ruminococcus sp.]